MIQTSGKATKILKMKMKQAMVNFTDQAKLLV